MLAKLGSAQTHTARAIWDGQANATTSDRGYNRTCHASSSGAPHSAASSMLKGMNRVSTNGV